MTLLRYFSVASAVFAGLLTATAHTSLDDIRATPEKAGGVYYAYPNMEGVATTPAPKGYKPFYVSHYGRHGSRYLISDNDYKYVMDIMAKAETSGKLTPLGKDVKARLDTVWLEAEGRGGELSPLGVRQHHGIAQRLYKNYPQIFQGKPEITASSTTVMRCAHSMFSFIEGLKELNPGLVIPRESGNRNMYFLNYHDPKTGWKSSHTGPWYQDWKKFRAEKSNPDRLMKTLFNDSLYVRRNVDPVETMWGLYWVAVDMQNMETPISFMDIFTTEELYDLWQVFNFNFYSCNSSYPPADGAFVDNAKNLVRNILDNANDYIMNGKNGATLRFGHDGNIIPLTALLNIEGCYADVTDPYKLAGTYSDYQISPMAANLQLIFFKNKGGDVLVKILLNEQEVKIPVETDIFPFYHWEDLKIYLSDTVLGQPYGMIQAKRMSNDDK
ncbi:MAG: histidine-type phosphatase [Muribaculaceae bacterium]|nr:histidine-type phosphatase [Muribaculaceae bacterium]